MLFRFTGVRFTDQTVSAVVAVVTDDVLCHLPEGVNAVTGDETLPDLRAVGRITEVMMLDFVTRQRIDTLAGLKVLQTECRKDGDHQY